MQPLTDWSSARAVLCVRLDTIGDVIMTTPALQALKQSLPGRRLTLLTSSQGAAVAPLVPEVDDVIVYDAPWLKATPARADALADFAMIQHLRSRAFDAAAIFTVYSQNPLPSALLCYLAGIPLRLAHCRENPYQLLTHWVHESEPEQGVRHECRRQLDLVEAAGCPAPDHPMSLAFSGAARLRIQSLLRSLRVDLAEPWAVVHPGASAPSRRYPPEHFAEVVSLLRAAGWSVLVTGSEDERPLAESVGGISLAGLLSLDEMAALLHAAPLLISNNTGPVHMAAALGTPVVDLYALTNPQHTPWQVPHRVLNFDVPCRNCYRSVCPHGHHDCLRRVEPREVFDATLALYGETGAAARSVEVLR
ncbi:MAG: lipopolysaccharide heptosyltransferase II [Bryobacteraceae bacterium]|nr:lipopolysaccharide heptosyltransferase II [Bryobacteraceae bacterium]